MMIAVGALQIGASAWGVYTSGPWRVAVVNFCVGIANLALAGQK
jgi:hypothetical protein